MSYLLSFWPVKSFLTYVLSRSVGKFLKNKIDFSNYDLHQKKITFKDLELNTQMINENLKDSPFKVMQISLGSVQINNPSLNLLSSKISLELANVEVILMPVLNVDESKVKAQAQQFNSQSEDDMGEESVYQSQEVKEVQKSEEYNILNNLFNKILSNLEVKITTISIKIMTRDVDLDETKDIPTFMLRLTNIEYKRSTVLDPSTRPISDWQVILDGKTLDLGELSLHLLPSCFIDQQREKLRYATSNVQGQNLQMRLKHPAEYPQINHYSTIFVIKPSVQQQMMFKENKLQSINSSQIQTTGSMAAISVGLSFPSCSSSNTSHQSNDPPQNQLLLKIQVPSIESICSYDQLKTITKFAKDIELYTQQKEGSAPLPTKKQQRLGKDVIGLELLSAKIKNGTLTEQEMKQVHDKALKAYKQSMDEAKKKTKDNLKDPLKWQKKDKKERDMIIKFIKLTQKKSEFKQLSDDLKKSNHFLSGQREENKDENFQGLSETQLLMTSTFQSDSGRKSPLSIQAEFVLNKVSLVFLLHDQNHSFDRIYDSIQLPPQVKPVVPGISPSNFGDTASGQQYQWFNILNEDNSLLTRQHQTLGCSHYNFELRDFKVSFKLSHFKRRQKLRSHKSAKLSNKNFKQFDISASLQSIRLSRYDLSQTPNHRLLKHIKKSPAGINVNQNYFQGESSTLGPLAREDSTESANLDQSSAQYESFSNNSAMFQSANEFYKLDQSLGSSTYSIIDSQHAQQTPYSNTSQQWSEPGVKKRHGGGGGGQSQINKESQHQSPSLNSAESFSYSSFHQQPILFGSVYLMNPYSQHFCRETVFTLKKLRNQEHHKVIQLNLKTQETEKGGCFKTTGGLKVGQVQINFGVQELLFLTKMLQDLGGDKVKKTIPQQNAPHNSQVNSNLNGSKKHSLEQLDLSIEEVHLDLFKNRKHQADLNNAVGLMIQRNSIQDVMGQQKCLCNIKEIDVLAKISLTNTEMRVQDNDIKLSALSLELMSVAQGQKFPLVNVKTLGLNVLLGCQDTSLIKKSQTSSKVAGSTSIDQIKKGGIFTYYENEEIEIISDNEEDMNEEEESTHVSKASTLQSESVKPLIVEDHFASQSQEKTQSTKTESEEIQTFTVLQVFAEKLCSNLFLEDLQSEIIPHTFLRLEQILKFFFVAQDISKCCSYEKTYETVEKVEYFKSNKVVGVKVNLKIQVQVETVEILMSSRKTGSERLQNLRGCKLNKQNAEKLLKIRGEGLGLGVEISQNKSRDRFDITVNLSDIMILDYLQSSTQYHPSLTPRETNYEANMNYLNLDLLYAPHDATFVEELERSAQFILLYKQQGLGQTPVLEIETSIEFRLVREFKEVMNSEIIATLVGRAFERQPANVVLQVCEEINLLKKNPMSVVLRVTLSGLIARLTCLDSDLITKLITFKNELDNIVSQLRLKPVIEVVNLEESCDKDEKSVVQLQNLLKDSITVTLQANEIALDFDPVLRLHNYEKVFNDDVLYYEVSGQYEESQTKKLRTTTRSLIQIQSLTASTKKNNNRAVQKLEIKNIGISLLKQNTTDQAMNPLLLLDFKKQINSQGDVSLLDYLGFSQILSVDLLKIKFETNKHIQINLAPGQYLKSALSSSIPPQTFQANAQPQAFTLDCYEAQSIYDSNQHLQQLNMSQALQKLQKEINAQQEQDFQFDHLREIQQELIERQQSQMEEDLFETSYGLTTMVQANTTGVASNLLQPNAHEEVKDRDNNKSQDKNSNSQFIDKIKEKEQKLNVVVHKVILYMAQDSYHTVKHLTHTICILNQELQQRLQRLKEQNEKLLAQSGRPIKKDPKANKKSVLARSLFQEDEESIQRILNEFLEVEVDEEFKEKGMVLSVMGSQQNSRLGHSEDSSVSQSGMNQALDSTSNMQSQVSDKMYGDATQKKQHQAEQNFDNFFYEQNKIMENGYFEINSGLRPENQDGGISQLQIHDYIQQEDRFQELSKKELNPFCYKKCHELPKKLKDMFLKMSVQVEVQSVDIKLYQGKDFDFEDQDAYFVYPSSVPSSTPSNYNPFKSKATGYSGMSSSIQSQPVPRGEEEDSLTQSMLTTSYVEQRDANRGQAMLCNFVIDIQNDYLDHKVRANKDTDVLSSKKVQISGADSYPKVNSSQIVSGLRESQLSVSLRKQQEQEIRQINQSTYFQPSQPAQSKSKKPNRRSRYSHRGFFFNFMLNGLQFSHSILKDYKDLSNFRTDFTHYVFSLSSLCIKENISKKGVVLRDLVQLQNQFKYENLIELVMKYNIGEEHDVAGFKVNIQPFKLLLNQGTVLFLQKFFDFDFIAKKSSPQDDAALKIASTLKGPIQKTALDQTTVSVSNNNNNHVRTKPVYVDQLKIQAFSITFCYTSHKLNFYDLTNGNIIELLNFFNINDLKIKVKPYNLEQRLRREEAIKHLLKFYKDDLIENQKINFVKAIGPLRSLFNIGGALLGVVRKPYESYTADRSVVKGLGQGFYDLYAVVTEESYNFTNKIRDGYVKVKKAAEKHL